MKGSIRCRKLLTGSIRNGVKFCAIIDIKALAAGEFQHAKDNSMALLDELVEDYWTSCL